MKLPDFIIGGAPKCGTSSLYFWLAAHPEVYGSPVKETFFFSDDFNYYGPGPHCDKDDIEVYANYFKGARPDQKAFEATAHYIYSENARKRLMNLPSEPKMIFLLREPSRQMYSHYQMTRYRIRTRERSFREYADVPAMQDLADYPKYLKPWLEDWGKDRVRVYLFEDLVRNKVRVLKDISGFLGIAPEYYDDFDFEHRNKTVQTRSGKMHRIGLKVQRFIPHSVQKILLPLYMKVNSSPVPDMTDEERSVLAGLREKYRPEWQGLRELLPDLPLELWESK